MGKVCTARRRRMPEIRDWHERAEKASGGHTGMSAKKLLLVWWARHAGHITPSEFRCWFAVSEVIERRRREEKSTLLDVVRGEGKRFSDKLSKEVAELCSMNVEGALRAVRKLNRVGLIRTDRGRLHLAESVEEFHVGNRAEFLELLESARREVSAHAIEIPLSRRLVRLLARGEHRGTGVRGAAVVATLLGVVLRTLYRHRVGHKWVTVSGGLVKTSWIAEVFGVKSSSVKHAMKTLTELGIITRLDTSHWCQQRHGRRTVIDLDWGGEGKSRSAEPRTLRREQVESRPRGGKNRCSFVPPNNQHPSLRTYLNQKPLPASTGVCRPKFKKGRLPKPVLGKLRPEDLANTNRIIDLFHQAVRAGIVSNGEMNLVRFVAAAIHAKRVAKENACGLFITTVRNARWNRVTCLDEDSARQQLASFREGYGRVPSAKVARLCALVEQASSGGNRRGWHDESWRHYVDGNLDRCA